MSSTATTRRKTAAVWTPRVVATTATLAAAIVMHAATLAAPRWATGETYHLASSSAFHVDLAAGLWGYCTTATAVDAAAPLAADGVSSRCYAFHSTTGDQELSVCEAFSRGFVYGTDDVRGVRFPFAASDNVHRIERPPTSLDDVNIQRFIEKSCGLEGVTTLTVSAISLIMGFFTLVAFAWTLGKPQPVLEPLNGTTAEANSSVLQFSSMAAFATVVLWLHQSWDLRQANDTGERVSIHLGSAMYAQLLVAMLYCAAGMGILSSEREQSRRSGTILKL